MKTLYSIILSLTIFTSTSVFAANEPKGAVSIQQLLVSKDATKGTNILQWETTNFGDVDYFIVEKATANNDFDVIGYVFAGQVSSYRFKTSDANAAEYRVKAVSKSELIACISSIKMN